MRKKRTREPKTGTIRAYAHSHLSCFVLRERVQSPACTHWRASCACCFARGACARKRVCKMVYGCARAEGATSSSIDAFAAGSLHLGRSSSSSSSGQAIIINRKRWMPGVEKRETCAHGTERRAKYVCIRIQLGTIEIHM